MSVYIKGMEMPTSCNCRRFAVDGWCYAFGKPNIEALANEGRTNFCPLVPVPDHKGPLVDALEVINTFPEEFIFTNEQARAFTNYIIPADKEETE